jgi:hypothetical protein
MSASPLAPYAAAPVSVATVVAADGEHVGVRSAAFGSLRAEVATGRLPRPGERVVVLLEPSGAAYVVGILSRPRETYEATSASPFVEERDGAGVRWRLPEGDLELCADRGRVTLRARDGVRIEADEGVEVDAGHDVVLQSAGGRSRLKLDGDVAELRAGLLEAKAARLRVLAEELQAVAVRADTEVERLRQTFEVVETHANRIVQNAKSVYQTVEDLAQTRAGRLRLVAEGSFHALAERAQLTAKKVFRVNGERIHLG